MNQINQINQPNQKNQINELTKNLTGFYLIGYEGRDIDCFLNDLIQNDIQVLIDVRNNPHSMKFDFNKNMLGGFLKNAEIEYIHIPELGIAKEKRQGLENQSDYEQLFLEYSSNLHNLESYLERIITLGRHKRVAIMCFERDPQMCHRREIGKYITERGFEVISL